MINHGQKKKSPSDDLICLTKIAIWLYQGFSNYNFAWIFMKMGALFDLSDPYFIYGHINPAPGSSDLFSDMITWSLKYDGRNSLKLTGTTSFFFSKLSSSESRKSSSLKWVGYLLSSAHQVIEDRLDARTRIICSLAPPYSTVTIPRLNW